MKKSKYPHKGVGDKKTGICYKCGKKHWNCTCKKVYGKGAHSSTISPLQIMQIYLNHAH